MRDNIIIKSMLRQPMRTAVLVLLIAASAFAFVMRAAEYVIVTDKIETIGGFYRSVGVLSSGDFISDASGGADFLRDNPYVRFGDRRRGAAGLLQGMQNADVRGMSPLYLSRQISAGYMTRYIPDAFFYGELIRKETFPADDAAQWHIGLVFNVDHVAAGYAEHVMEGSEVTVHYYPTDRELVEIIVAQAQHEHFGEEAAVETAIDAMAVGQRYFVRGMLLTSWIPDLPERRKIGRDVTYPLTMRAVNESTSDFVRARLGDSDDLWYIPVQPGELIDYASPEMEWLGAEIGRAQKSQIEIQLRTSVDMEYLPYTQGRYDVFNLHSGRLIDRSDHLNANPVAVISRFLAEMRGLEIGDTITLSVPREQYAVNYDINVIDYFSLQTMFLELGMTAVPQGLYDHTLELEIVGLYTFLPEGTLSDGALRSGTYVANWVYIPDSVLPGDIAPSFSESVNMREFPQLARRADPLPSIWYSFVLDNARDRDAFLLEYRDELYKLGYSVAFIENGDSTNFWASAGPILQSVALNFAVFGAVLVLVLALVAHLYLRQRKRDFAIMRALGCPPKRINGQFFGSVLMFGLPPVAVAGVCGWYFALDRAASTLSPFQDAHWRFEYALRQLNSALERPAPIHWLPIFILAVSAALLIIASIGARRLSRLPVLELLQGTGTAKPLATAAATAGAASPDKPVQEVPRADCPPPTGTLHIIGTGYVKKTGRARVRGASLFILRHILRSAVRSSLFIATAVFFTLALGWLRQSISLTGKEIDRLYDTTTVGAAVDAGAFSHRHRGTFPSSTVYGILDSGYARNEYIMAWHTLSLIAPPDGNGELPDDWMRLTGFGDEEAFLAEWRKFAGPDERGEDEMGKRFERMNPLVAFTDLERFIAENSASSYEQNPGFLPYFEETDRIMEMHVEFGAGFGEPDFAFAQGEPIPIIVPAALLDSHGLGIGDTVYIGHTRIANYMQMSIGDWEHVPALIIGAHNSNIIPGGMRDAVLMPLAAMEHIFGERTDYIMFAFDIDQAQNRELAAVRRELERIVSGTGGGILSLVMLGEELVSVVGNMEQNLSFMRLLYTVALVVSAAIGLGLSLLLMLQNAKNAAIMRVLGMPKAWARLALCTEQLIVNTVGLALGVCVAAIAGWGHAGAVMPAALYLAGTIAGAAAGCLIVTNRPPLELLQVRE